MATNLGSGVTSLPELQNETQRGRHRCDDQAHEASVTRGTQHWV